MSSEDRSAVQTPAADSSAASAPWFGRLAQADFEIEFYERVLARDPDQVCVLRALGEQLARQGLWPRSMKVEQRLIELRPGDGIAHYNLACSLAMQGAVSGAIDALARAIDCGYRDFAHFEIDPDLESVRHLPAYRALLRNYGRN